MTHSKEVVAPDRAETCLRQVLRHVVGPAGATARVGLLSHRPDYYVFEAEPRLPHPAVIVKLAGPGSDEPLFNLASAAHQLAARRTVLDLPQILAVDDSMSRVPFRFLVKTRAEGQTWAALCPELDTSERDAALAQLGEAVAELHSPCLSGFGPFAADGSIAVSQPVVGALAEHACRIIRIPSPAEPFREALRNHADLFDDVGPPTICHDDLHGFNVLFSNGRPPRLSAILDFDKAWAGPAESDMARMELWTGMTGATFWSAYRRRHPERDGYKRRRPFYQLLWCLEYAQNSEEHLWITNDLLRAVGLSPIDRFPG